MIITIDLNILKRALSVLRGIFLCVCFCESCVVSCSERALILVGFAGYLSRALAGWLVLKIALFGEGGPVGFAGFF